VNEVLLGIDIGTSGSKAVVCTPDGEILARAERSHRLSLPHPGWAEHDAEAIWWTDVRALCAELVPGFADRIAGVCVSGIGPCVVPCDGDGRPLRPAILYGIDTRATAEVEAIERRLGADAILARGGSVLSSQALGPKLEWIRLHEPDVWRRTRGWYMASSFVIRRLTGEYVLDHHSASQCDPLYDLGAGTWAEDWAASIAPGVPLPRLVWPAERVGEVSARGAELSGIPVGTPVMGGTIDAWAEAFSVGVRSPGDLMIMYGSTLFLVQVLDRPLALPGLWSTRGVEPGTHSAAAGMATSGILTDWLRTLTGEPSWEQFAAGAADVPPGSRGLLILPYFAGERSPLFDPDARGAIAGLTLSHGPAELARAVYEATAFSVHHNLAVLADAVGPPARAVAVGGGTKGTLWTAIVSDVAGIEQELPAETIGASYGDALLAAIGSGIVAPETDWSRPADVVRPDPSTAAAYRELYDLYLDLGRSVERVSHRLADVQRRS
jgi:xylulokinase